MTPTEHALSSALIAVLESQKRMAQFQRLTAQALVPTLFQIRALRETVKPLDPTFSGNYQRHLHQAKQDVSALIQQIEQLSPASEEMLRSIDATLSELRRLQTS